MTDHQFSALIRRSTEMEVIVALKAVNTEAGAHRIARAELDGRSRMPILLAADARIEEFQKGRKES